MGSPHTNTGIAGVSDALTARIIATCRCGLAAPDGENPLYSIAEDTIEYCLGPRGGLRSSGSNRVPDRSASVPSRSIWDASEHRLLAEVLQGYTPWR